jgi:hypothetical protein
VVAAVAGLSLDTKGAAVAMLDTLLDLFTGEWGKKHAQLDGVLKALRVASEDETVGADVRGYLLSRNMITVLVDTALGEASPLIPTPPEGVRPVPDLSGSDDTTCELLQFTSTLVRSCLPPGQQEKTGGTGGTVSPRQMPPAVPLRETDEALLGSAVFAGVSMQVRS